MNKESIIFTSILLLILLLALNFEILSILLIFTSLIFLYIAFTHKNRYLGIPSMAAVFTILIVLYTAGLIAQCHVCTTNSNGIIFFCERLIDMTSIDYKSQLNNSNCEQELIWVFPITN